MNKEIADKWVAELRSGKHLQGRGRMKRVDDCKESYCCLGVLRHHVLDMPDHEPKSDYMLDYEELEVAGMISLTGSGLTLNSEPESLASLNDNGRSFSEIADIIEQNWESL